VKHGFLAGYKIEISPRRTMYACRHSATLAPDHLRLLRYHRIVGRRYGVLVAALTIWLGAGPLVRDQCFAGCHQDTSTARSSSSPACHEAPHDGSGALWQAITLCDHDHSVSAADTIAKAAPESPLKVAHAALVSQGASAVRTSSTAVAASTTPPSGGATAAFPRPLRL
jgi:hypothetical protein